MASTSRESVGTDVRLNPTTVQVPEEWESVSIEDIASVVTDGAHQTPTYVDNGVRFLSTQNLEPFRAYFDYSDYERYIPEEEHRELAKRCNPSRGDVLVSKCGTIGQTQVVRTDEEFSLFVGLALVKPNGRVNAVYLEQILNWEPLRKAMEARSPGSTRRTLPIFALKALPLPLPPLEEQRKIASVLYTVDQLVERTKAIVGRLQSVKRGLLQDLIFDVQGPLTHEQRFGPLTFRVPRSWSRVRLKEVTSLITRGRQPEYADEGVPVINQECIYWDGFRWGNIRYLDREAATEWKERYFPKTGDILINSTGKGTLGRAQVYRLDGGHVVDSHVTIVRPDPERLLSSYLRWLLESKRGVGLLYSMCVTGSTGQIELSKSKLSLLSIPLPPIEEQERIVEGLEEVQANIRQNQYFQQRAKRLKRGLMQDLLSGKVRIDDVEIDVTDEVARYG